MKATINGMEVEGTPDELLILSTLVKNYEKIPKKGQSPDSKVKEKKTKTRKSTNKQSYKHWYPKDEDVVKTTYESPRNLTKSGRLKNKVMKKLSTFLDRSPQSISIKATTMKKQLI